MMPPRVVWRIRPSGVVPYRLSWAQQANEFRRAGDSPCLVAGAVLQAAFLTGGAVVSPGCAAREAEAAPPRETSQAAADAGTCTLALAANVKPAHGPPRTMSVARPWEQPPSVAVRKKADGAHRPS